MSFWEPWHNNIGQISDRANNEFYIEQYWEEVLSHLNANTIYEKFDNPYIPTILLCYESHGFCHRHIASAWLELETGIKVPEIKFGKNGRIEIADRPWWIKEYLQHIMAL
ncbi:hypothetical protein IKE97_03355 [Candidatus Saccharibacteria bacterium]|nr:hypothetical protein [Candidatus Saccharibacteria bacterium]